MINSTVPLPISDYSVYSLFMSLLPFSPFCPGHRNGDLVCLTHAKHVTTAEWSHTDSKMTLQTQPVVGCKYLFADTCVPPGYAHLTYLPPPPVFTPKHPSWGKAIKCKSVCLSVPLSYSPFLSF